MNPWPRGRMLIGAGLSMAALATVALLGLTRATGDPAVPAIRGANAANVTRPSPMLGSGFRQGLEIVYELHFSGTQSVTDLSRGTSESGERSSGAGKLALVVERSDASGTALQGTFSELRLTVPEEEEGETVGQFAFSAALTRPFRIWFNAAGAVSALATDPALSGFSHAFVRAVVASLQFVDPASAGADRWTARETDHLGECDAQYERLEPVRYRKTCSGPVVRVGDALLRQPASANRLSLAIRDPQRMLRRVETSETVTTRVDQQSFCGKTELTLTMVDTREGAVSMLTSPLVTTSLATEREPVADDPSAALRSLVAGATFRELLAALRALPDTDETVVSRWTLVKRLGALFELEPTALREAARALRDRSFGERAVVLAALGNAQGAEPQAVLTSLARDGTAPPEARRAAVTRLALHLTPNESTLQELTALANETLGSERTAALLALGGAVRHASETTETARAAKQAVLALDARFRSAATAEERAVALGALGNTGSAESLASIRTALVDPDPLVRASAVRALRLVPGTEVDALIAHALADDAQESVRFAAVLSFDSRPSSALIMAACGRSLRDEPAERIRLALVAFLSSRIPTEPDARALVAQAREADPSDQVRTAARLALDAADGKTRGATLHVH